MRKAVFAVAVVVLAMISVSAAKAETVLYSTWGSFANPGAGFTIANVAAPGGISTIHDGGANGSTITFSGASSAEIDSPTINPLGVFTTTVPIKKGEIDTYTGTTFTLTIDQLSPTTGIGTIVGTLSGTLRKSAKGIGASSLELAWSDHFVTLGGVTYTPVDLEIAGATLTTDTTLQGNITAVPVPASAMGGMGLFALIGSWKLIRRRSA